MVEIARARGILPVDHIVTDKIQEGAANELLAIGDGLGTDVKGANEQRLDCLFVAAGIFAEWTLRPDDLLDGVKLEALLMREGLEAAYALPDLVW